MRFTKKQLIEAKKKALKRRSHWHAFTVLTAFLLGLSAATGFFLFSPVMAKLLERIQ
jgi:nanoRNase/pAp phosphatase (c-di-AMP/oligoRNAs hydrolase)